MSFTLIGNRALSSSALDAGPFNLTCTSSIVIGDHLLVSVMGWLKSGDAPPNILAGSLSPGVGAEVWTEQESRIITSDAENLLWHGVYTATALAAYASGVDTVASVTTPQAFRCAWKLLRYTDGAFYRSTGTTHNGADPFDVSLGSPVSGIVSTKIALVVMRKGSSLDDDPDWSTWGGSGVSFVGSDIYGFYFAQDPDEVTVTVDASGVASEDSAVWMGEFNTAAPGGPAGLVLRSRKAHYKDLPYHLNTRMLGDGEA